MAKKCAATALAAAVATAAVAVALPLLRQTDNSRQKFELASTRMTTVDNDQSAGLRADRVQHRGIEHSSPTLYICQVDSFSLSLSLSGAALILTGKMHRSKRAQASKCHLAKLSSGAKGKAMTEKMLLTSSSSFSLSSLPFVSLER